MTIIMVGSMEVWRQIWRFWRSWEVFILICRQHEVICLLHCTELEHVRPQSLPSLWNTSTDNATTTLTRLCLLILLLSIIQLLWGYNTIILRRYPNMRAGNLLRGTDSFWCLQRSSTQQTTCSDSTEGLHMGHEWSLTSLNWKKSRSYSTSRVSSITQLKKESKPTPGLAKKRY